MKTVGLFISALFGGAAGWIGAWAFYDRVIQDQLAVLTPVVVLDATWAVDHLNVRSSREEIQAAMDRITQETERLKSKGVLVLKQEAVAAAPESVYVRLGRDTAGR